MILHDAVKFGKQAGGNDVALGTDEEQVHAVAHLALHGHEVVVVAGGVRVGDAGEGLLVALRVLELQFQVLPLDVAGLRSGEPDGGAGRSSSQCRMYSTSIQGRPNVIAQNCPGMGPLRVWRSATR